MTGDFFAGSFLSNDGHPPEVVTKYSAKTCSYKLHRILGYNCLLIKLQARGRWLATLGRLPPDKCYLMPETSSKRDYSNCSSEFCEVLRKGFFIEHFWRRLLPPVHLLILRLQLQHNGCFIGRYPFGSSIYYARIIFRKSIISYWQVSIWNATLDWNGLNWRMYLRLSVLPVNTFPKGSLGQHQGMSTRERRLKNVY